MIPIDKPMYDFSQFKHLEVSHPDINYIQSGQMYAIYGMGFNLAFFDDDEQLALVLQGTDFGSNSVEISKEDFIKCMKLIQFLYTIEIDYDIMHHEQVYTKSNRMAKEA